MTSTFTPNKNLEMPGHGDYDDNWDVPVNADWSAIDNSFGGFSEVSVTGVSGTTALTISQYQPPNITFLGTLSQNLIFVVPAGVGGIWTINNATSGSFSLTFGVEGGGSVAIPAGLRLLVFSDGSNLGPADNAGSTEALNSANQYTASQISALAAHAADASNLTSGTVPNAQLPNAGSMPGITIAPDPGTVPSGPAGSIWYYY